MYNHTKRTERQWLRVNQHTQVVKMRYFLWDNSSNISIFLSLRSWMNLLDMAQQCWHVTYKQPQVKTKRNGCLFFFLCPLKEHIPLFECCMAIFNKTLPPPADWNWRVWGETKNRGLLKRKHQGYVLNSLRHATVSTAKWLGDCRVFTNIVDEVMVQGRKEAYLPTG